MDKTRIIWWRTISCIASLSATCWHGKDSVLGLTLSTAKKLRQSPRREIAGSDLAITHGDGIDLITMDAQGRHDTTVNHHDQLCRSAYGSRKYETRARWTISPSSLWRINLCLCFIPSQRTGIGRNLSMKKTKLFRLSENHATDKISCPY